MKQSLKEQAIQLREDGWSYNIISQKIKISKSTLSNWLKEIPYTPNEEVIRRIKEGPAKSGYLSHKKRFEQILSVKSEAALEIGKLTQRDLWMLGIGLYIGEGSKIYEHIRIINSDPDIITLAIKWFKEVCGVKAENFTIAIHIYPDTQITEAIKFWSDKTGVNPNQFGKTQVDRRTNKSDKKKRKLPYGTAHVTIKSCGNQLFGVVSHRKIIGWIEEIYRQTRV